MLYNEEIELDEDFEGVDDSEAEVVTEFDEIDENTDYDNNYTYVDIDFQQDTPQLINTPTPVVDPVVEETELIPDPEFETVTETYEMIIQEYSQEYLQALEDDGYTFYVIYEDGTEDEVDISEIEEPTTSIEFLDDEAYVLANSILEHFWDDDSGVHVTQDTKEAWAQLVEDNFPDLDATHPHHNIIVNSYGVLIRSALKNLVQLSRSALAFYDGLGNNSSNIISTFGRGGIQIGPTDQKHLIINNNGITVYNGDGTIAPLTASNIAAIEANIQTLTAADATITGRLTAAEGNITTLTSSKANVTDLTAATARIDILEGDHVTVSDFQAEQAKISALQADHVTVSDFEAEQANIDNLQTATADIATIRANSAKVANLTAQQLEADHATVGSLSTNYAHISNGVIDNAKIDQADVNNLSANYAHIANGIIDNATIDKAKVNGLSATYATIESLNTANARITDLEADHVSVDDFEADHAVIESLDSNYAHITNGVIDNAKIGHADVNGLSANYAHVSNGVIDNAKIDQANVNNLSANYAHIANGVIDNAKISYADVNGLSANYAQVNMANVNNAWIQNGTVKDGAITNAMINSVSANKLTAGTIDASNITVTNLNADNITTGTINGQRIGAGSLSLDKLEDEVYTETEVDSIVSNLQTQIDGAIETWTGTDVPTLNNAPASSWNTNSIKDTHVGDVYFVVNSQSQQNGYNYRFTKTTSGGTSTYSWQLIKDNDVTNALQRLTTAEGKIGTIEQFDSTVSSFMTNTDNELTSIKSAATTLSGRVDTAEGTLATKVDTTTFNSLSQTVEGHSSSITQLTTETTTLTQAVDTLNTKTSSDSGNIVQFSDSIGFKEIVVHGKSTQVTTTGKNLLDLSNRTIVKLPLFSNTTSREMDESYVYDGITLSNYGGPDNVTFTEFDGTYTVTAASSGYGVGLPSPVMPNTSYCASSSGIIGVGFYDADGVFLSGAGGSSTTVAFVTPSGCEWVMLILRPPANVATKYTNIQLELGSTATSYEPYTGGKPAPNPDYPQEIKSVDDLTLHICGKNLFDPSHLLEASNWTVSNGVYTGWGSALHTSFVNGYPLPPFVANTRYTLSFDFDYDGDNGIALVVNFAHADGTQDVRYVNAKNSHQVLTSSAGRTLTAIGLSYGTNRVIRLSNIQVEQASTATDYEPYQGQSVDIPLGDHQIRSLPDGTDDTLTFSYIGPSIREGWGLYSTELVQNVQYETFTACTSMASYYRGVLAPNGTAVGPATAAEFGNAYSSIGMTSINLITYDNYGVAIQPQPNGSILCKVQGKTTADELNVWLADNPVNLTYHLPMPITHSLGVVELLLSEDLNLWATTSPSTAIDATWWHEPGRVEKNEIDISLTASNLGNAIDSTTLPAPYTEVEWVESDGHQIIQLDWIPNKNGAYGFDLDFENRNTRNSTAAALNGTAEANRSCAGFILGARDNSSGSGKQFVLGCYTPGYLYFGTSTNYDPHMYYDGRRQQCSYHNGVYTAPDGNTYNYPCGSAHPTWGMVLFGLSNAATRSTYYFPSTTRMYSCKFYDGDTLAVDLIPAIRNSDKLTGLYDKVAEKFWPAAGMSYGNLVRTFGAPKTIVQQAATLNPLVFDTKTAASRLWTGEAPTIDKLEDGQRITYKLKWQTAKTAEAIELAGRSDSGSSEQVYLKLTLANGNDTDWIPCYCGVTTTIGARLTSHYTVGSDICFTYHENIVAGTVMIPNGWFIDANYDSNTNTNDTFTRLTDNAIAGLNGLNRYTLCMRDENGLWTSIVNEANDITTTKTCYTGGLMPSKVCYHATAADYASGVKGGVLWESYGTIDFRYSLNIGTTAALGLTQMSAIYLVGTINPTDGLFYLDTTQWWTQNPSDDTKIYIYISAGRADYYRSWLAGNNPMYIISDGELIEYTYSRITKNTAKINETIDTVDEHTQRIGTLETTIETKANGSDLTTVSNTLNTVSQTATSNSQKITNLTTRLGTNADGTAGVNDIIAKESALEQDLDGFKTTVSSTYSTKTELSDSLKQTDTASGSIIRVSGPIDNLTVDGKSTQVTTTGKNLFDPTLFESFENVIDLGNGMYAINTPLSTIANKRIWDNPGLTGPHYVSYEYRFNQGATAAGAEMYVHYIDGTTYRMGNTVVNVTWRLWGVYIADMTDVDYIYVTHNKSTQTFWRNIQITSGSTAQDWEPYTGGSVAPSPAYPQTIFSIDECVVYLHGKNLIDQSTLEQGSWGTESKTTSTTRCRISNLLPVTPSTTYTFSGICAGRTFNWYIREFNANGKFDRTQTSWNISGESITIGPNTKYICVMVRASDDSDVTPSDFSNLQLEVGTTATPYEPYVGQTINIPLGDHIARSLPDGTRDELTLTYQGPSTREGWGVFGMKLTQNVDTGTITSFTQIYKDNDSVQCLYGMPRYRRAGPSYINRVISNRFVYNYAAWNYGVPGNFNCDDTYCFDPHTFTDLAAANAWLAENPITLQFPIATPQTIDLGTVELPIITEDMNVWATTSPATDISAEWYTNMGLGAFGKLNTDALGARMTTAESSITQNADNINLKVSKDGVISSINQSAETVKIQASKVEIDGTAIFNSISSNVDTSISNSISSAKLVKTTQDQWYSSTSATTKTGGSWATTQPSIVAGRYIWQRQYVTYSDNTTAYLPSEAGICTQGQTDLSGYSTTTQMNSAIGTAKQEAIAVANSKRRIFTATPTVPYDVGDLWVNGTSVKYASTSKADGQTYSESDWTVTATDDTLAQSAVDVTHRIYYRTATANSSLTAPTTWIEEATGNVYNQWTTKVPPLAASTATGQTKYLYLYTCEQRKRLDGTISCTKVLLDENTTVIDGGSIVTNSVTANQIAAGAITAEKLDATNINASNSLTIGALSTQTQSSILNSELSADIASAAKRTDVSIAVTAIDYAAGTATLQASLYIDGVVTTSGVTYQWLKDGTNISGQTSRTLSVTSAMGLSHVYSCTATY